MSFCFNCGHKIGKASFCSKCGNKVNQSPSDLKLKQLLESETITEKEYEKAIKKWDTNTFTEKESSVSEKTGTGKKKNNNVY